MSLKKRVLIIGLDGFCWNLGYQLIAENIMPNLACLVNTGCHGILKSVTPCETAPAWTSFQTGCYPGKTSVLAFHRYDRSTGKVCLSSATDIAVPTIWELADNAGRYVASLNMPLTSPPPKLNNGIIIPGFLCPALSPQTTHPPHAYSKYIKPCKNYQIVNLQPTQTIEELVRLAINTEQTRCEVALEIIRDIDWDIFCIQVQSTDRIQHSLWQTLMPSERDTGTDNRNHTLEFYRSCDRIIGTLIKAVGDNTMTVIASDHGFTDLKRSININLWLKQNGFLHLRQIPQKPDTFWNTAKKRYPPLKFLARYFGKIINREKHSSIQSLAQSLVGYFSGTVDFEKTTAFCLGGLAGLVYLNTPPADRTNIAETLTARLIAQFGPASQNPVIAKISRGNEIYKNSNQPSMLPDLVVEYFTGISSRLDPLAKDILSSDEATGTHNHDGVFLFAGPNIKKNLTCNAAIVDILPTILAYSDIPIPRHIDGRVLKEIFVQPPQTEYQDTQTSRSRLVSDYSAEEEANVEKQLKDLGYL